MRFLSILLLLASCGAPFPRVVSPNPVIIKVPEPEKEQKSPTVNAYGCHRDTAGNVWTEISATNPNEKNYIISGTVTFTSSKTQAIKTQDFLNLVVPPTKSGQSLFKVETSWDQAKNLKGCYLTSLMAEKDKILKGLNSTTHD